MIISVTHDQDGRVIQRLSVSTKISIGLPLCSGSLAGSTDPKGLTRHRHFRDAYPLDLTVLQAARTVTRGKLSARNKAQS